MLHTYTHPNPRGMSSWWCITRQGSSSSWKTLPQNAPRKRPGLADELAPLEAQGHALCRVGALGNNLLSTVACVLCQQRLRAQKGKIEDVISRCLNTDVELDGLVIEGIAEMIEIRLLLREGPNVNVACIKNQTAKNKTSKTNTVLQSISCRCRPQKGPSAKNGLNCQSTVNTYMP